MSIMRADKGSDKVPLAAQENSKQNIERIENRYKDAESKGGINPPPFITGKDLIAFGIKPSPRFREILEQMYDKQLNFEIKTKEEAINYLKRKMVAK